MTKKIDTKELAKILLCNPNTPRRSLCINGHYLGLRPTKLPNGRLLWDRDEVERLVSGGEVVSCPGGGVRVPTMEISADFCDKPCHGPLK